MHVVTANTSLVHIGGTANANGNYQGISLGYSEAANANYRKVAIISAGINDSSARQDFHVLVDTASDSGSTQLADSKFKIDGVSGRCQAKNGLMFGTDTAVANALDDYEEGTWTPNVAFSNSTGSITYGNINNGYYTKIGNTVHITATLHINARSGGSGDMRIGGLPFNNSSVYVNSFAPIYMGIGGATPNVPSTAYSGPYMQADGHSRDYCDVKVNRDEGDSYKITATDVKTGNQYWHINGHYTSA